MKVSIRPHPTHKGWYQLECRPDGKKGKKQYLSSPDYAQALADAAAIEAKFSKHSTVQLRPRLSDVIEEHLSWVKENQADKTWRDKVQAFKIILPHFGNYRPDELNQRVYDEFARKLSGKRAAIIKYQHYLSALIKWMAKRNLGNKLNFEPEKPEYHRPIKQVMHPTQIDTVLAHVPEDKRLMLELMLLTGLRWNEAAQLRWEDVDMQAWTVRVRESDQEEQALVNIPAELQSRITGGTGYIFANPKTGLPWGSFKTMLHRIEQDTGIKLTPHMLRHASATYLYEATGDIYAVQHHLRHKDVRTSQIYTRYSVKRGQAAQESLAQKLAELRGSEVPNKKSSKK